jgi:hypothetical protein
MQSTIFSPSNTPSLPKATTSLPKATTLLPKATPSLAPTVCSKNPKSNFTSTDVSTNSSCFCPKGQSQISKKMGGQMLYKCEKTADPLPIDKISTKTCNETPFNPKKESNWNGLSKDPKCGCPDPFVKIQTKTNKNTYYTCSRPISKK